MDPKKCFQDLISENTLILLRDRPCLELVIVPVICRLSSSCRTNAGIGLKAIDRYRPKGVLGKGVGKNKNASEMCQKSARDASQMRQNVSCLLGKDERSKMRQKCVDHLSGRTPFGRYQINSSRKVLKIIGPALSGI